jgi:hypothetical protein
MGADGILDKEFESFEIGEVRWVRGMTVGLLSYARNSNDRHARLFSNDGR